jgi:hypothetical protein
VARRARPAGVGAREARRPERAILAAAGELGRAREFPGYLRQRAEALEAAGGPCSWDGLDRSRLTPAQLSECVCSRCAEWRAHLTAEVTA